MVSQGEHWYRNFIVEAKNLEHAKKIYAKACEDDDYDDLSVYYYNEDLEGTEPDDESGVYSIHMQDPRYLADIENDVEWYEEDGFNWVVVDGSEK